MQVERIHDDRSHALRVSPACAPSTALAGGGKAIALRRPACVVGICTRQRPESLASCIDSVVEAIRNFRHAAHLVVVENDSDAHSRQRVEARLAEARIPYTYLHEPKIGIPFARNRVIECALEIAAGAIAFVDDDEVVDPRWLSELHQRASRGDCQVVQGAVVQHLLPVDQSPASARTLPAKQRRRRVLRSASTNNVLFSIDLVRPDGLNLRFDPFFAMSGGSDNHFFRWARVLGCRIVYHDAALTYEIVPASRQTHAWRRRRSFGVAINNFHADRIIHGNVNAIPRHILKSAYRVGTAAFALLAAVSTGRGYKHGATKSAQDLCSAAGSIAGILRWRNEPYKSVDGH